LLTFNLGLGGFNLARRALNDISALGGLISLLVHNNQNPVKISKLALI
jgi:hypothetical protein